ncbi:DNA repair protein RecO [Elusimicrobiota bacterium]
MYHQLKGLILKAQISSEADKLLTIYTYEWGKITAIAPGAKKIKAKFSTSTEPLTENEFYVYASRSSVRPKITSVKPLNNFSELYCDWRRFTIAQYCSEIAEVLTPFNSENANKYELISRTLSLLETAKYPWRIFIAFTLRFLKLSGYSFIEYLRRNETAISKYEKNIINKLATLSGEDVDKVFDLAPETEKNIKRYIDNYLNMYLPRSLATKEFCQKINFSQHTVAAR